MSFWTENRERRIGIFMLLMSIIFSNNWNECKFNGNDMVLLSKQIFLFVTNVCGDRWNFNFLICLFQSIFLEIYLVDS